VLLNAISSALTSESLRSFEHCRSCCDVLCAYCARTCTDIMSASQGVCVCVYIHTVARTNSCKNVVLQGCGKLQVAVFYFFATRSSQMNVEAANDVDPKY